MVIHKAVDAHDRDEFAPLPRAMGITGLGKSTIYRGLREKWFPAPVKVGRKSPWPVPRLHAWVRRTIEQSDGGPSTPEVGPE
ncbi:helix-turn-helix transcriptional regulator [Xanthomonas arboricola]|uniref:helix-turn-helix transcriptional regulator n=1 Tax=Xanthomonas arboricola TaxID=56448 RepID=UPI003EB9D20A